ncbi:MAG: hypothetical protein AB7I98_05885 [Verrucomicrobiales bacterium]
MEVEDIDGNRGQEDGSRIWSEQQVGDRIVLPLLWLVSHIWKLPHRGRQEASISGHPMSEIPNLFIQLIQLGFHGFAFALFFLSFQRFGQISAQEIPDNLEPAQIERRMERTDKLLGMLKWFMVFSVLFFVLGVSAQIIAKRIENQNQIESGSVENQLTVSIFPGDMSTIGPTLKIDGRKVALEDGTGTVRVGSKGYLAIDINSLINLATKASETKTKGELTGGLGE